MKLAMLELCKLAISLVKRIQWLEKQSSSDLQRQCAEISRSLDNLLQYINDSYQ